MLLPIDKLAKRRASQAGETPPANAAIKGGVRQPLLSDDRLAATGMEERWHGGKAGMMAIELSGSLDPAGTAVVPLPIQVCHGGWWLATGGLAAGQQGLHACACMQAGRKLAHALARRVLPK